MSKLYRFTDVIENAVVDLNVERTPALREAVEASRTPLDASSDAESITEQGKIAVRPYRYSHEIWLKRGRFATKNSKKIIWITAEAGAL